MKEFLELYDPHEKQFGGIKLIGICNPVDFFCRCDNQRNDFQCCRLHRKKVCVAFFNWHPKCNLNHKKSKS